MTKKNDFDDEIKDTEIKHTSLNIDIIKNNIPKYSSQKLCEMIVCDRYFGLNQQISIACMEELGKRRINGDNLDFENYIDKTQRELPQLNFDMPDLRAILGQAIKNKK